MIKLLLQMMESEALKNLFLKLVNMSISASWIVLVVLILRLVLKKAPKWIPVLLWGIVAVRLICPISIESALSLIPSTQTIPMNIEMAAKPAIDSGINAVNSVVNPIISASFTPHPGASANPLQIWIPLAAVIWCVGMALMILYTTISYWRLRRSVDTAVRLNGNIYQSENVGSPFVLGILKSRIYLPYSMDGKNLEHVVAHELAHIRRKDHWWKPLGFLLLTVYWFNPLMWMAYILLCRDIELACDEKVIAELGNEQRADYTQALVACSVNRRMIAACPLAFGEVGVKDRVKSIMNYRKPAFWIIVIALVLCVLVAVCFLTNPLEDSWIKITHGAASVELECNFAAPINAYAIYEDIYESGKLVSSEAIVFDNFQDEGGATARRTEISLSVQPVNAVGGEGYTGALSVNFGGAGIAYMTRTLPKDHYTDYVHVVTEMGNRFFSKQKITTEDSVTLYSIVLSTDLLGVDHKSLVARVQNNTLPQSKDTVVIYRLVTSENVELNHFWGIRNGRDDSSATNKLVRGKTFLYEEEGILGSFTITLYEDKTFTYYEGMASSYMGMGTWSQEGDFITLTDDKQGGYGLINHFILDGNNLVFIEEDSTNFIYLKVKNGDEFRWTGEAFRPNNEIDNQPERGDRKILSLNDVIILSQKGYDLTWSDFEQFEYIETGFGLYIRRYEINDQFHFAIGGAGPNSEPMYMYLGANGDDPEAYIDIREGGVTEFISEHKTDSASTWDRIPMVMVDGVLYLDTGMESTAMARCGVMDGEITSQVDGSQEPTIDNQSNFGTGYGYQYGAIEGTIEINMNDKWWIFATEEARKEIQFPSEKTDMELMIDPIVPVTVVNQITGEMNFVNSNQSVREIQTLISSEWWAEGNPACDYDFKITVNGESYMYHSDCGTFADISADRCIELDENQQITMDRLLSEANDVLDRFWLTIGEDGVKSIEIKTAHSSGGCENADGSLFKKGDRIWLECLDGYTDLRGVSFIALDEDGQIIWQASVPDGEDNEGFTHLRNDDWNITNIP